MPGTAHGYTSFFLEGAFPFTVHNILRNIQSGNKYSSQYGSPRWVFRWGDSWTSNSGPQVKHRQVLVRELDQFMEELMEECAAAVKKCVNQDAPKEGGMQDIPILRIQPVGRGGKTADGVVVSVVVRCLPHHHWRANDRQIVLVCPGRYFMKARAGHRHVFGYSVDYTANDHPHAVSEDCRNLKRIGMPELGIRYSCDRWMWYVVHCHY